MKTEEEQVREMLEAMGDPSLAEQQIVPDPIPVEPAPAIHEAAVEDEKLRPSQIVEIRGSRRTDVAVSTLTHILGVATVPQIEVLEAKIDLLTVKLNNIAQKLDRLTTKVNNSSTDAAVDRIDYQLNEIRALFKRSITGTPARADAPTAKSPKVLKSSPPPSSPPTTTPVQTDIDALAEFDEFPDDATFQTIEAKRMREAKSDG